MTARLQDLALTGGTWTVSDSSTRVTFTVTNFGRAVQGSVACSRGEVEIDDAGAPVRVRAELDLNALDTGIAKRDLDLRKPRFLDIDRQPTMAWTAERISREEGGWIAEGALHVRGTSAPLTVTGRTEVTPGGAVRVLATATLDRTAVGIRAPRLLIGRSVEIDVDALLTPPGVRR